MKKTLLLCVFISFHSMATFSGHWIDEDNSQSLTLDLIESGAYLTGKYCFITNNGNRIDCSEGNEENINGIVKNNVGVVSFESTFVVSVKQHCLLQKKSSRILLLIAHHLQMLICLYLK